MGNKEVFFSILNNFIHPDIDCKDLDKVEESQWDLLFSLAMEQAVFPIIYDKAWDKEGYESFPEAKKRAYHLNARNTIIAQSLKTEYFLSVYRQFTQQDIHPLVVKGIILRNIYQKPDYRVSSDEDLLINKKDFKKVDKILLYNGYTRSEVENPLKEHEISYYNPKRGSTIELHLSLFPETSGAYGHLNTEFQDVFIRAVSEKINGVEIYTLCPTQHMLYLVCHSVKHFMHSGFGVRQLCDIILFAETYGSEINWNEVIKRAKDQKIYTFLMNLFEGGERYLGFSWEKAGLKKPDMKLDPEDMLDDMIDGGVFGKNDMARLHSSNITLQAVNSKKEGPVSKGVLFPDLNYMKKQYPYLKKRKYLLPAAWAHRIFYYGIKMRKNGIERTIDIGNKRVKLLKKYDIIQ